jgi:hypothetical protein
MENINPNCKTINKSPIIIPPYSNHDVLVHRELDNRQY